MSTPKKKTPANTEHTIEQVWRDDADGDIRFWPDDLIPQEVNDGARTGEALEAFFTQPRRR